MTQEEKARAYDEVLNKLRHFIARGVDPLITRADVQDFFPELAESEDDGVWLKKYIQEEIDCLSIDIRDNEDRIKLKNLRRSLAWIEKQGEKGTNGNERKIPFLAWSEEDERIRKAIINVFASHKDYENFYGASVEDILAWLERQGKKGTNGNEREIPILAWSEEDDKKLEWLCRIIHSCRVRKGISLAEESEIGSWVDKWLNWKPSDEH